MANTAVSDRTALVNWATGDLFLVTDVSDTTDDPAGTSKKVTGQNLFRLPDGSAGTPSLSWQSDTDTGFYWVSSGKQAWASNGTQRLLFQGGGLSAPHLSVGGDADTGIDLVSAGTARLVAAATEALRWTSTGLDAQLPLTVQEHIQESEQVTLADDATHIFTGLGDVGGGDGRADLYILTSTSSLMSNKTVFLSDANEQLSVGSGAAVSLGGASNPDVDGDVNIWCDGTNINVKNRLNGTVTFILIRKAAA